MHDRSQDKNRGSVLRVLLVEDSEADRQLVMESALSDDVVAYSHLPSLSLFPAECLAQALGQLALEPFDAVLLDLNLPDSTGLETLHRLRQQTPDVAVVVLTGMDDNALIGAHAIRHGAQDYLNKQNLEGALLTRAICYAVERHRLWAEQERSRQRSRQEQEIQSLEQLSDRTPGKGLRALSLERIYGEVVRNYVISTRERREKPREDVRALASRLVTMEAGARDVVLLHLKILRSTGHWTTAAEERAFSQDARLVLVEILGYLTDFYRERALDKNGP
ncbi:MAG: response regulator [Magnetococcales bacterium]|nr:response regulator [Magnetococcales bacterium]